MVLQWTFDNTTNKEPPLAYRVTYLPIGGVATTMTVGYQEYSMTLNNLTPNTLYEISISAMTSYFTSDPLKLILKTTEGKTNSAFRTLKGKQINL